MKGLPHNRYSTVILEPLPAIAAIYHPGLTPKWLRDAKALAEFKPLANFKRDDKKEFILNYIDSEQSSCERLPEPEVLKVMENLSLASAHIPNTLNEENYLKWFDNKFLGVTELFDQSWDLLTMGSARSFLLSNVQVKGSGRTLPSFSLWHPVNSGLVNVDDAITAFAHSHLADTTLPLGSNVSYGVLALSGEEEAGLYLRASEFPRLAQIGPILSEQHKNKLIQKLKLFHGSSSVSCWIKRIMGQYAAMAFLGANFHGNADNLLINGHPIDEEDWMWPQDLNSWSFVVDVHWKGDGKPPLHLPSSEFPWEKCQFASSTFDVYETAITNIIKAHAFFISEDLPSLNQAREWFFEHLLSLSQDVSLISFWKKKASVDWRSWILSLESHGYELSYLPLSENNRFFLKMKLKRTLNQSPLIDSFNTKERINFTLLPTKLKPLKTKNEKILDACYLSRKLCSLIARSGFVLPTVPDESGNPVENSHSWEEFCLKVGSLYPYSLEHCQLVVWDGMNEQFLNFDSRNFTPSHFIPLALKVPILEGNDFEIPLWKTVVYL